LHNKYSSKRLKGEWFDISLDEVEKEIEFHQDTEDSLLKSNFQLEWAKTFSQNYVLSNIDRYISSLSQDHNKDKVKKVIKNFPNASKKDIAIALNISRNTLYKYIKK